MLNWLFWLFGLGNGSSSQYLFWSGIGSDLTELAIVGGLITMVRPRNCEIHRCWRLGRHQSAAGHRLCRKHHPDDVLTVEDAHAAHEAARDAL
jgi:hypothetical protein